LKCLQPILLLCAFAAAGPARARADSPLLTAGSDTALWLVRRDDANGVFDAAVREADGAWEWSQRSISGRPAVVTADRRRLHVLFANPAGHVILQQDTKDIATALDPRHPLWPAGAAPAALCPAPPGPDGEPAGILALVPRPAGPAATRPATTASAPSTAPALRAKQPRTGRYALGVFRRSGVTWEHLADVPGVEIPAGLKALLAATKPFVYVLLVGGDSDPPRLARWGRGAWSDVPMTGPAAAPPAGMLAVGGRLVVLLAPRAEQPGRRGLTLATLNEEAGTFTFQPVVRGEKPATWPADALPRIARLGEQVSLIWREGEAIRAGTCLPSSGVLTPGADVEIFGKPPADGAGETVIETFLWIVLLGVFIPMILLRPRGGYEPFALPEGVRPGSLLRRAAAATLDFVPISLLVSAVYRLLPGAMSDEEVIRLWERLSRQEDVELPVELAVTSIAVLVVYVVYCAIMELYTGTTLGKRLMKLRVLAHGGVKADLRQCILRNLLKIVELISLRSILFFLVPLVPIVTRYRQRFGDLLARTAVIDARVPIPPPPAAAEEPHGGEDEPPTWPPSSDDPGG